ncbi:hypothetical protein [Caballeronia sordidicola]|uniref:hypothetical protein n=1 Tax=Caballeronia sordidicola TaxID=196367 RepID=UPI000B7891C2|nr:hypothetical protein [Caballeronia sordidicola]
MAHLQIGKSLAETDVLWRYLTLDKFINLVESSTLFFTPLAWYKETDPFEGYLPKVAMDAIAAIPAKYAQRHEERIKTIEQLHQRQHAVELAYLRQEVARVRTSKMKALHRNMVNCLTVNCWYRSQHESEGMWGLFSKGGVAIKTSVRAVEAALGENQQDHHIFMGAVKYLDFSSKDLTPPDCVSEDGHLMGMIKRVAYAHENEVRMYITDKRAPHDLTIHVPAPAIVQLDVDKLIEGVVISPVVSRSIEQSIRAVCRWGNVDPSKLWKSSLLEDCEYLLGGYD